MFILPIVVQIFILRINLNFTLSCGFREDMRRWRERQLRVVAWSVNKPVEKKYFSKILKVTYMTDTMIGEPDSNGDEVEN